MSSQLEPRSLRALVCALALAGGCFNESGAASQDDSSPGTSSSGTGGPECGADVVLPAPLTEPYSEWFVAAPGPQGQDAACPEGWSVARTLYDVDEAARCSCDCGEQSTDCSGTLFVDGPACATENLTFGAGPCGIPVIEHSGTDRAGTAPTANEEICNGESVLGLSEQTQQWTLCRPPAQTQCIDAALQACVLSPSGCPEGTVLRQSLVELACDACNCTMFDWCSDARVALFAATNCNAVYPAGEISLSQECGQVAGISSATVMPGRLGCHREPSTATALDLCCAS